MSNTQVVSAKKRGKSPAVQIFQICALLVLAIALGLAILYCITKVGDLNAHASVLQTCLSTPQAGCPNTLITTGQIAAIHNEADTLGDFGWFLAIVLGLDVASAIMDKLEK